LGKKRGNLEKWGAREGYKREPFSTEMILLVRGSGGTRKLRASKYEGMYGNPKGDLTGCSERGWGWEKVRYGAIKGGT